MGRNVETIAPHDQWVRGDDGAIIGVQSSRSPGAASNFARFNDDGQLLDLNGAVMALSEAVSVQTLTTTGTAFSGACEFRGFVVRSESGGTADVTIYDATSATGTAIMTVANIGTGTYYWDGDHATPGVGTGGRRVNSTGCHVVISGTCTIDVMVE